MVDPEDDGGAPRETHPSALMLLLVAAYAAGQEKARARCLRIIVEERAEWRGAASDALVAQICEKLCIEIDESG